MTAINEIEPTGAQTDYLSRLFQKKITLFSKAYGTKKKEDLYSQLGVLLYVGITFLNLLAPIQGNQKMKKIQVFSQAMVVDLVAGESFSNLLQKGVVFSEYAQYSVKIDT